MKSMIDLISDKLTDKDRKLIYTNLKDSLKKTSIFDS